MSRIDGGMEAAVRAITPNFLSDLWVVAIAQVTAALVVVMGFHAASWGLLRVCNVIARKTADSEIKWHIVSYVLKPMAIAMPYLGYLVGFMRLMTGVENVNSFCASFSGAPHWLTASLPRVMGVTAPLCDFLAKVIVAVMLGSLSYTILLVKNRLFETKLEEFTSQMEDEHAEDVTRLVVPFNSLATWLVWTVSAITILITFGFNPQPLLALGSVSGIVVGFASQEILLNLFSGVNIFITRPFVVGDMVDIQSVPVGTTLVKGIVVKIQPLRTVVLTDGDKLTTLPNRLLTDSLITNFSMSNTNRTLASETPERTYYLQTEFTLDSPEDRRTYTQYAKDAIRAVLTRLSIMRGLQHETVQGHVVAWEDGKYRVRVTAAGTTNERLSLENMQEQFVFGCHDAVAAFES